MKKSTVHVIPAAILALLVVTIPTSAQAEEKLSALQTALSSTTISGYVNTSAQWDAGTGNGHVVPGNIPISVCPPGGAAFGDDVSDFARTVADSKIVNTSVNIMIGSPVAVDNIASSSVPVPEPSAASLLLGSLVACALFLLLRRHKALS